jgi:hypothetical protein
VKNANAAPPSAWRATSCHNVASPVSSSTASATCTSMLASSEPIITSRRGSLSATTPPTSSVAICANVRAAKARPTSVAEPVIASTANATAIGTRFEPKNEIVRAAKSSRKFGCRSTSTALIIARSGQNRQPWAHVAGRRASPCASSRTGPAAR